MSEFVETVNEYGRNKVPFLFLIDFEMEQPRVWRSSDIPADDLLFKVNEHTNASSEAISGDKIQLTTHPVPFEEYKKKFEKVYSRVHYGDSYLTNLTIRTKIEVNSGLRELFLRSTAKYKLWLKDRFLVFSPETFVQIVDGEIRSFPMKGTIDASVPDAEMKILADQKELAEHVTIVDLIRNDLSLVAEKVSVRRFRYVDKLTTIHKDLLQVSSEVVGQLKEGYQDRLGEILFSLLPAGSISGAPKSRTVEIIREAEQEKRGYYTGVFGWFDGKRLDSGVLIRFVEQAADGFYYRSGGGITSMSNVLSEYEEVINKIYVPVN